MKEEKRVCNPPEVVPVKKIRSVQMAEVYCPDCYHWLGSWFRSKYNRYKYCPNCGLIDWKEVEK